MALDEQNLVIPMVDGLDTRTQQKLMPQGKFAQLENVTFAVDDSLRVRDGMACISAAAVGNALAQRNDELLVINGSAASRIAADTGTSLTMSDKMMHLAISATDTPGYSSRQDQLDCAYGNGLTAYVWRASSAASAATLRIAIVEDDSGSLVYSAQLGTTNAAFPRIVYSKGYFCALWIEAIPSALWAQTFSVSSSPSAGTATQLVTSMSLPTERFDAAAFADYAVPTALVLHRWTDGSYSVLAQWVTFASGVPSLGGSAVNAWTEAALPTADVMGLGCSVGNATCLVFAFAKGASASKGLTCRAISTNWTILGSLVVDSTVPTSVGTLPARVVAAPYATTTYVTRVFWDNSSDALPASKTVELRTAKVGYLATLVEAAKVLAYASVTQGASQCNGPLGPFIAGKPTSFLANGQTPATSQVVLPVCVLDQYAVNLGDGYANYGAQGGLYWLDGDTGAILGRALYGTYGQSQILGKDPNTGTPCSCPTTSKGATLIAPVHETLSLESGQNVSRSSLKRVDFSANVATGFSRAQLGQKAYLAGGALVAYDGGTLAEHGLFMYPAGIYVYTIGGASVVTAGVHQVCAVYEWLDAEGCRHQSAPSPAVPITIGGGFYIAVAVPCLLMTNHSDVRIALYMTAAGGLTFYRASNQDSPVSSTKTGATNTGAINISDATLTANEPLYTQPNSSGTPLQNDSPHVCTALAVHQNRLWTDRADDPFAYRFSQELADFVGLQFSENFAGRVPSESGGIVGFASMDEKLIIFCKRKLYVVTGNGPDTAGSGSSYSEPSEIASDVGCSARTSILKMPNGIIFKTGKGWYELGRDLTVKYIGAGVKAYDANDVTAATLLEDRQECRFSSSSGTHLVFGYLKGQWSVTKSTLFYAINDACSWRGRYVHVSSVAHYGLSGDWPNHWDALTDNNAPYSIIKTIKTAFIHLSQLGGFERVRWLVVNATLDGLADPNSLVTLTVDFDGIDQSQGNAAPGAYSTTVLTPAGLGADDTVLELAHKLNRQKCESVRFTIVDTPLVPAEGSPFVGLLGIQSLTLRCGVKRGVNKLPAADRIP